MYQENKMNTHKLHKLQILLNIIEYDLFIPNELYSWILFLISTKKRLNNTYKIGKYDAKSRKQLLKRFHNKREKRILQKKQCIRYGVRKELADNRPRIKGRFIKKN